MQNIKRKMVITGMTLASITGALAFGNHFSDNKQYQTQLMGNYNNNLISQIKSQANINPNALQAGLVAYYNARHEGLDKQHIVTIIDYSAPSTDKRLYVIDVAKAKVLYNTLVAHGKNSGGTYATRFSNSPTSNETSIGVYLTGQTYNGEHGQSMRLIGLDKGFNTNAYARAIVMHSAWYVGQNIVQSEGRIGRSWGCMALSQRSEPKVVNTIKDGTIIVAYYPDKSWMQSSHFLQPATATV